MWIHLKVNQWGRNFEEFFKRVLFNVRIGEFTHHTFVIIKGKDRKRWVLKIFASFLWIFPRRWKFWWWTKVDELTGEHQELSWNWGNQAERVYRWANSWSLLDSLTISSPIYFWLLISDKIKINIKIFIRFYIEEGAP